MDKHTLQQLFDGFNGKHLLLLGDVMLDAYVWGKADRISPEAPVPVLTVTRKEERLGGLANVAVNLRQLGARVSVCSVTGDDDAGKKIAKLFSDISIDPVYLVTSGQRTTTVKTRIIGHTQHIVRIDEEQSSDIDATLETAVLKKISAVLDTQKIDAILFEDYNKGVLTANLIQQVITLAKSKNIPTCVDPKKKNFFAYKGVTLFKPNLKELTEGLKLEAVPQNQAQLITADNLLRDELNHTWSLITLSEKGVFYADHISGDILPAHKRDIADVSGAGDTVIAVAALCLAGGCSLRDIAFVSNLAGGLVCEKVGVVPVNKDELLHEAGKFL